MVATRSSKKPAKGTPEEEADRSPRPAQDNSAVAPLLQMQRLVGNQATCEMLRANQAEVGPRSTRSFAPATVHPLRRSAAGPARSVRGDVGVTESIRATPFPAGREISAGATMPAVPVVRRMPAVSPAPVGIQRFDWPWKKSSKPAKVAGGEARLPTAGDVRIAAAKPSVVVGAAGTAGGGMMIGGATGAAAAGTLAAGGLVAIDSAMGLANGYRRQDEAAYYGDSAGTRLGKEKVNESKIGLGNSALGLTGAGLTQAAARSGELATGGGLNMGVHAANATQWAGHAAAGIAATSMSIAAGVANMAEGAYKMWQSLKKTGKLDAKKIYSKLGNLWAGRVRNRETWKKAFHALKIAAGVLGVVGGALMLASNPVGWAIGIAAAVTGAAMGIGKAVQKYRQSKQRKAAASEVGRTPALEDLAPAAEPAQQDEPGKPSRADRAKRAQVKAQADEVARIAGTNAQIAGSIRDNLDDAKAANAAEAEAFAESNKSVKLPAEGGPVLIHTDGEPRMLPAGEEEFAARDAYVMLQVLGIKEEEAKSDSGQELIEKTMSVNEAV